MLQLAGPLHEVCIGSGIDGGADARVMGEGVLVEADEALISCALEARRRRSVSTYQIFMSIGMPVSEGQEALPILQRIAALGSRA